MEQVDIVRATYDFYDKNNRVPIPQEVDKDVEIVEQTTVKFANKLLHDPEADVTKYKGFFTEEALEMLQNMHQNKYMD